MADRLRVSTRTARSKGYARKNTTPRFTRGLFFTAMMRAHIIKMAQKTFMPVITRAMYFACYNQAKVITMMNMEKLIWH